MTAVVVVVVDGAVDVSATVAVDHARRPVFCRRSGQRTHDCELEPNDNGGDQVHGAVNDDVDVNQAVLATGRSRS